MYLEHTIGDGGGTGAELTNGSSRHENRGGRGGHPIFDDAWGRQGVRAVGAVHRDGA